MKLTKLAGIGALAAGLLLAAGAAQATVYTTNFGGTTLSVTTVSSTEFKFDILNPTSGWSGAASLGAFAFNTNILGTASGVSVTGTGISQTSAQSGGLNAGGCNGSGAFFCFSFSPSAAVASSMDYDIKATGGAFAFSTTNVPDLKIQFLDSAGGKTGDLFSADIPLGKDPVPEPATWLLMLVGVGAIGGAMRARKTTVSATVTA